MSDTAAVVMALAAAAGAWAAQPLPRWWAGLALAAGLGLRRPALLCLGVALATSALAARSWAGLRPPATVALAGVATLVGDPEEAVGGVRAAVRIGDKRVEAWARGPAAGALASRLAGERLELTGRIEPLPARVRPFLARQHVAARLAVARIGRSSPGDPLSRVANGLRRTLLAGSTSLSPERRALFAGFVFGDDRGQPPEVVSDFRASGLAHLLAVSGQNVAFVLALAAPLLRRLGLRTRVIAGLVVLVVFGTLTRWEPSVLRAAAMAMLALMAAGLGRTASRLRLLALAVTAVLLVDPLLVGSIGFLLSVGACCGIALLAAPLADALPGPRSVASVLGVTLGAQIGVAPVLVPVFGGLPVAALPANLLAVPAAGPLTLWGMAAGLPAGVLGPPVAGVLHAPTGMLVGWVAAVARHAAALPLGRLEAPHLAALAVVLALGRLAGARRSTGGVRLCLAAGLSVLMVAAAPAVRPPGADDRRISPGARLWRHGGATVLVVDDAGSAEVLLDGLRSAAVGRVDVLVVSRPGRRAAGVVETVLSRVPARVILAPAGTRLAGALVPRPGSETRAGDLAVHVDSVSPALRVEVSRTPRPAAATFPGAAGAA